MNVREVAAYRSSGVKSGCEERVRECNDEASVSVNRTRPAVSTSTVVSVRGSVRRLLCVPVSNDDHHQTPPHATHHASVCCLNAAAAARTHTHTHTDNTASLRLSVCLYLCLSVRSFTCATVQNAAHECVRVIIHAADRHNVLIYNTFIRLIDSQKQRDRQKEICAVLLLCNVAITIRTSLAVCV